MKITYKKYLNIYHVEEESLQDIALKTGIHLLALEKWNRVSSVSCGDYLELHKENVYVVKPLDTLYKIANKLGVDERTLVQKNNIQKIFIGQILYY